MPGLRNKIFISYRREDSSGHVGRLHDALAKQMGPNSVFMDIDSIAPGADFVQVLHHSLEQAAVVVVVMGGRWVGQRPDGTRRIDDPNDFVRLEVAKALADPELRVIPVLVNRAEMISESALPDELKALARRNAIEVSDIRWAHDTKLLADEIAKTPGDGDGFSFSAIPTSVKLIGAAVALVLALFLWKPWQSPGSDNNYSSANDRERDTPGAIPAAPEMKMPKSVLPEVRALLKKVKSQWKADAFVDEINLDCRSGQCMSKVLFVSPELMQGLTASRANPDNDWTFENARGTVTWGTDVMPLNVMDFQEAIAKARAAGMVGPIASAVLGFYYPQGQTKLVWWLTPKIYKTGGQRSFCFDATSALLYDCAQLR
ncbi:MAG: TIR domain-containing protein [Gemmatimonas sp.]